jgi:hypothetical protein
MYIFFRIVLVIVVAVAIAIPASAQSGSGVLNRFAVQQLVATDTAEAHAALGKHFIALADAYRSEAARYSALAKAYVGNPNHPTYASVSARWMRKSEDATTNAHTARAVAAYHQVLSLRHTARRPAGGAAFDGGKGAPPPTAAEMDELVRAARTPPAHRELVEYFLTVARTETANAEAYTRTARQARVSGARNTEVTAARYEHLASTAREAARRAILAVELHRQLAVIG